MPGLSCIVRVDIGLPWFHFAVVYTLRVHDGAAEDRGLLASLLQHPLYADAFEGPSGVGQGRHGPFLLETISPESFEPCSAADARSQLLAWLELATEPDPDPEDPEHRHLPVDPLIEPMFSEHVLSVVAPSNTLYRLALPDDAQGPEWRTSRADGFHEFVALNPTQSTLTLIVCTDD